MESSHIGSKAFPKILGEDEEVVQKWGKYKHN
jgi:hypothetical protein